jgi:hypothetical protein
MEQPTNKLSKLVRSIPRRRSGRSVSTPQFHLQRVPRPVKILQVLRRPQTSQFSFHHDSHSGTESVRLLHGVRGQNGPSGALETGQDGVPQEPLAPGVHPGAGLVQKHHFGIAHHRHGERQLPPSSSGALLRLLVRVLVYLQTAQVQIDDFVDVAEWDAADGGVTLKMLPHCDILPQSVVLRAIAQQLKRVVHIGRDIFSPDLDATSRRGFFRSYDLHGCGFPSSVVAEQPEDLSRIHRQRQTPHGDFNRVRFFFMLATTFTLDLAFGVLLVEILHHHHRRVDHVTVHQVLHFLAFRFHVLVLVFADVAQLIDIFGVFVDISFLKIKKKSSHHSEQLNDHSYTYHKFKSVTDPPSALLDIDNHQNEEPEGDINQDAH